MLLGIDLGSSTLKIAIYNQEKGKIVAVVKEKIETVSPHPNIAEQDPYVWWKKFVNGIKKLSRMGYEWDAIEGIGIVSQREGVILVDKNGRALTNCITWMDRRSEKQAYEIKKILDEKEVYYRTGLRISAGFTATKLLWFKENIPEILERTAYYLQPKDYLVYMLTGEFVTDFSLASRTLLFDIHNMKWIDEYFEKIGISNKFPKVYWANKIIGETTSLAYKDTGIKKGVPVVAGGGDRQGENLGCCKAKNDSVAISLGTTINLNISLEKPYIDPEMRSTTSLHVLKNKWLLELGLSSGTILLRWFVENFAQELGEKAYQILTKEAEKITEGSENLYVFPFLIGVRAPWWRTGIRAGIINFSQGHTRAHFFRAFLESLSYNIRAAYEVIEDAIGKTKNIYVMGGGAENKLWINILSNVLGKEIKVLEVENAGVLAAAILPLIKNTNIDKLIGEPLVKGVFTPNLDKIRIYSVLYSKYMEKIKKYFRYYSNIYA